MYGIDGWQRDSNCFKPKFLFSSISEKEWTVKFWIFRASLYRKIVKKKEKADSEEDRSLKFIIEKIKLKYVANKKERANLEESWETWEIDNTMTSKYYVESITDSIKGFRILLSDAKVESKKLVVLFEDSVHSYRSSDESYRLNTINNLDERYGTEFYRDNTFFKVTNSEYIKWISLESYGIVESALIFHFSFIAVDSIVDVIAAYEPKLFWFKHTNE